MTETFLAQNLRCRTGFEDGDTFVVKSIKPDLVVLVNEISASYGR